MLKIPAKILCRPARFCILRNKKGKVNEIREKTDKRNRCATSHDSFLPVSIIVGIPKIFAWILDISTNFYFLLINRQKTLAIFAAIRHNKKHNERCTASIDRNIISGRPCSVTSTVQPYDEWVRTQHNRRLCLYRGHSIPVFPQVYKPEIGV